MADPAPPAGAPSTPPASSSTSSSASTSSAAASAATAPTAAAAAAPAATKAAAAARPTAAPRVHELRFGSYPLFTLFWPLVVGGELCAALLHWQPEWQVNLTWVYITILMTSFVAVGFDVRRNLAIGWLLFVALCWVGGLYLNEAFEIPVLSQLKRLLAGLDARIEPGFMHAMSVLVSVGLVGVLINVFLNHRWRITANELHLFRRGDMEDAITRGAKRLSVEYPDVFELLLLGAGHVVVRDSRGKEEIRRIPRVPFLVFRENKLDQIAEAWAVTNINESAVNEEEG